MLASDRDNRSRRSRSKNASRSCSRSRRSQSCGASRDRSSRSGRSSSKDVTEKAEMRTCMSSRDLRNTDRDEMTTDFKVGKVGTAEATDESEMKGNQLGDVSVVPTSSTEHDFRDPTTSEENTNPNKNTLF